MNTNTRITAELQQHHWHIVAIIVPDLCSLDQAPMPPWLFDKNKKSPLGWKCRSARVDQDLTTHDVDNHLNLYTLTEDTMASWTLTW